MVIDILLAQIEPLAEHHNRSGFSCGIERLDRYLQIHAGQDIRRKVAATFVMTVQEDPATVIGYYSLSSTGIDPGELETSVRKKLPPYPLIPATLIGRLARDERYKGSGVGEHLLVDALNRSFEHSREIASFAVIVDAINERAHA